MINSYIKDPQASRVYTIDWSDYLTALGEGVVIAESDWSVPDELTAGDDAATDSSASIRISGGTVTKSYSIYNKITTSEGDVDRRAITIQILDAAFFSETSEAEVQLSALRVALGQKAARDRAEYSIANRMKKEHSFPDLLAWEKRLTEIVNSERLATNSKRGGSFFRNHHVRFRGPS